MLKIHLHVFIRYHLTWVHIHLQLYWWLDVSEACKLVKMSSKSIPRVIESLVTRAYETTSFNHIVSLVESRCWKVLVCWMYIKLLKRICWSDCVLPHIANDVVEIASFEHVYGIRRHPELHVDVTYWLVLPIRLIRFQLVSDGVVLVLSGESSVFARLLGPPFAEGSGLEVVDFRRPVPRHVDLAIECPEFVVVSILPPEKRKSGFDGSYPSLSLFSPKFWSFVTSFVYKLEIFSVTNQHFTSLKPFDIELLFSKLVIPSISLSFFLIPLPSTFPVINLDHFIDWNIL